MTRQAAKEWADIFNAVFAQDEPQGVEARAVLGGYPRERHHVILVKRRKSGGTTVRLMRPLHTDAEARRFLAGMVEEMPDEARREA